MAQVNNGVTKEFSDSDDISSDSDTDSDECKPPAKISIERSADLATLKKAFLELKNAPISKANKDFTDSVKIDKNFFNEIASTFENPTVDDFGGENLALKNEREKIILDKDAYTASKKLFDNIQTASDASAQAPKPAKISIERNEADKKRVQKIFYQQQQNELVETDNNCEKCQKTVFHIDKIRIGRSKLYHRSCLACLECQKSLSNQQCVVFKGGLFCKYHGLKILLPDQNQDLTEEMAETMQISIDAFDMDDGDLEIINAAGATEFEADQKQSNRLDSMPTLSSKRKEWEQSIDQANNKATQQAVREISLIEQGRVKSQLNKFAAPTGDGNGHRKDSENGNCVPENEEDYQNANIGKPMSKKREELKLDVNAKSLKSKFEDGSINSPSPRSNEAANRLNELSSLKSNDAVPVKERFKPMPKDSEIKKKIFDDMPPVSAAFVQEAKEKFAKGEAGFQDAGQEKHREILTFTELSSVKEKFENNARKSEDRVLPPAIAKFHELDSLKASFESGTGKKKVSDEEMEAKRKKQLEIEFRRLQIEKGIFNEKQKREADEEAKTQKPSVDQHVEKCAELGSLKQKFEQGSNTAGAEVLKNPILQEIAGQIDSEISKSIKAKFENIGAETGETELIDEKRRNIQAEFENYKKLKEEQQEANADVEADKSTKTENVDSDLAAAAEHAQKMKARWGKIQKKEAKKAQKAANLKAKQLKTSG